MFFTYGVMGVLQNTGMSENEGNVCIMRM